MLVCLLCGLGSTRWVAAEGEPAGPLPLRNYQPIQQVFLNLPFERARVLRGGQGVLTVEAAHSNVIATDQGAIDAVLKFEQNRFSVGGGVGLGRQVQCFVEIPFGSRFGGFLDPLIDSTEDLFGAFNPERRMFPNNSFGGFEVRRGEVLLFHGPRQVGELMDSHVRCQWQVWGTDARSALALRGAVKVPTGRTSAVWGSGTTDVGWGVALDFPASRWFWLYGNLSGVKPLGRVTPARWSLDAMLQQAFGMEWLLPWRLSAHLQQALYTSPFSGVHSRVLDGTVIELALGFTWANQAWVVQLAGVDNVSGVAQAADFTLFFRVQRLVDLWPGVEEDLSLHRGMTDPS